MIVYKGRWLLPVTSPPVEDSAVAVDGERIVAAGAAREVVPAARGDVEVRDLGDAVLLPGLVNAHTHLELSWLGAQPPAGGDFSTWLDELLRRRGEDDPPQAAAAAERELARLAARGTVAVGDVSNRGWIIPILARSALSGVAFHEIYGFRSADAEVLLHEAVLCLERLAAKPEVQAASSRWRIALTPHAPYTTSVALLRALAGRAAAAREPLSVHVAESAAESTMLLQGQGPLAELLRQSAMWDEGWTAPRLTPVELLDRAGVLSRRTLAVHCVHLTRQDHSRLQARGVTVVTCPRSNRRLGVGQAQVVQLARQGIPVALGTDSLASAPDLDLFGEMQALRQEHPELTPAAVLRMATFNGARALGLGDRLGTIEPGKQARLAVLPLPSTARDPLEWVCSGPREVYALESAPSVRA